MVVLFSIGLIASTTHIHSIPRAVMSVFNGTINLGAGMVHEVAISSAFFGLVLLDFIFVLFKKEFPYVLRVVAALIGAFCAALMGGAYIHILGNPVWCSSVATLSTFFFSSMVAGLVLYAVLAKETLENIYIRVSLIVLHIGFAISLVLEIMAFNAFGAEPAMQIFALIVGPFASLVALFMASKAQNSAKFMAVICVLTVIAVAINRYAFYASWTMI